MEQCGAVVAGLRELDLAGHGRRWKEAEEGEVARRRGSGATYRPESNWARAVASGEVDLVQGDLTVSGRSE